jgi:hypothetical protein
MSSSGARLAALLLVSICMLGVAVADEDGDPPGRVARLSYVQGSVSLQPAGQQEWVGAEQNRPLTTSDKLWADAQGSRAELDVGGAVIRVGANTGVSFLNLDDNLAQMQVTAGTVIIHVRELLDNQTYEIDTPNVAVVLGQPGQYRIEVSDSGDSTVVRVSDGQAEATGGGQSFPINNQQTVTFFGNDQIQATAATLGAPDGFDDWSFERDREYEQSTSRRYVADNIAGAEDLDENGQWQDTPDYGAVWVPTTVAVGWAPYSFGHWAWIAPWGWTWVDNAPWGFAPFHYGRWARWHDSWCWVPGPRRVRPVYAPAMVAWAGGSAGGVGVSWFPLGPREVYVPGYHVSERYVRTINVTNTTIVNQTYITNVYRDRPTNIRYVNSTVPGAVTTVSRTVFTSAQPVNGHRMSLPSGQVSRLSTSPAPPAIAPVRQSMLGGAPAGFGRRPPQAVMTRAVVARTPPPAGAADAARVRLVGPRPMQQRQPIQQRPGGAAEPPNPADSRSWADRAHALEQRSLPASHAPGYVPPPGARPNGPAEQGQVRENERGAPNAGFRADRPPAVNQPERFEQSHPPVTTYQRPPMERAPVERPMERAPVERMPMERGPAERPQFESRGAERNMPASPSAPVPHFQATPPPPAPVPHFQAPPPPPAPVPHFQATPPPPAPVPHMNAPPPMQAPPPRTAPPPQQQHAPPPRDERPQPGRPGARDRR